MNEQSWNDPIMTSRGIKMVEVERERAALESAKELQAMVQAYDGSVPFPEFAERYAREHPSKFDFSPIVKYIYPLNDPRRRKEKESVTVELEHDGKRYRGIIYQVEE